MYNIQKPNFNWRSSLTPLNLNKVTSIALHHMSHLTADEYEVHKWHLERDNGTWKGFGYNYWIGLDGRIIEGRGLNQGSGVMGKNSTIISIGFQGDYEKMKEMPKAQFDAGVWLINHLKEIIPSIKAVDGHHRWQPTSCPGRYFPLKQMIEATPEPPRQQPGKITVKVNGKALDMDVDPININGRVMVPVRYIAEALGRSVEWDDKTNTVNIN